MLSSIEYEGHKRALSSNSSKDQTETMSSTSDSRSLQKLGSEPSQYGQIRFPRDYALILIRRYGSFYRAIISGQLLRHC
jgi:hypothetical protein